MHARRRWWRKGRWVAAGLLWLSASYPLSLGPADYAMRRGWLPVEAHNLAYGPLGLLLERCPYRVGYWVDDYRSWWFALARRHAGTEPWQIE